MSVLNWLKSRFAKGKGKPAIEAGRGSMREFVYLDEVSLRSLLSSQTGEVTDSKSEQSSDALFAELESKAGVNATYLAKADIASRFQTSNSSTLQTSRKATVQSWFREFHNLPGLRLIEPTDAARRIESSVELESVENRSICAPAAELKRGSLVEFRVMLRADPVFHIGTMVSEFTSILDESPELFSKTSEWATLGEAQRVNKIVQRLLAGLIPVRAQALDHSVVEVEGKEYIVRRDAIDGIKLEQVPLEIVGVTEHLAYWKDIRRVLFSDGEFTMLCRVARSGLQSRWTPVKLADLFKAFAPDMVDQINAASRTPFAGGTPAQSVDVNEILLAAALRRYQEALLVDADHELTAEQAVEMASIVDALKPLAGSVSGQRSAFDQLAERLFSFGVQRPAAEECARLRKAARNLSGLPLFPALSSGLTTFVGGSQAPEAPRTRLLDVEVVAIYW